MSLNAEHDLQAVEVRDRHYKAWLELRKLWRPNGPQNAKTRAYEHELCEKKRTQFGTAYFRGEIK